MMSTVQEIENVWMEEEFPQPIDAQFKTDLDEGRMDASIRQALADYKTGNTREL